ncbi:MAG: hypothetical protein JRM73_03370 [Nitrososphaerota archaeon]|nr:hypothetical protein [Nitrososphaerota archaeon]
MRQAGFGTKLGLAALMALTLLAVPAALASGPTYSTTTVSTPGSVEAKVGGYQGVIVNVTSSQTSSLGGFVYMDLTNAAGQTVSWNVGYCNISPKATTQCFVSIPLSVATGNYTAAMFVSTPTGVAISTTTSLKVTV